MFTNFKQMSLVDLSKKVAKGEEEISKEYSLVVDLLKRYITAELEFSEMYTKIRDKSETLKQTEAEIRNINQNKENEIKALKMASELEKEKSLKIKTQAQKRYRQLILLIVILLLLFIFNKYKKGIIAFVTSNKIPVSSGVILLLGVLYYNRSFVLETFSNCQNKHAKDLIRQLNEQQFKSLALGIMSSGEGKSPKEQIELLDNLKNITDIFVNYDGSMNIKC